MHFTRNNNVNTLFSNPEIPGFGIPGLQSLHPAKRLTFGDTIHNDRPNSNHSFDHQVWCNVDGFVSLMDDFVK